MSTVWWRQAGSEARNRSVIQQERERRGRHETSETGNSGNRHTPGPHLSICVWTWLAPSSRCDLVHQHGLFMRRQRAAPTEPVNGGNRVDVVRQRWRVITDDYVQRRNDKTSQQRKVKKWENNSENSHYGIKSRVAWVQFVSLHMEPLPVGCLRRNNSFTLRPPSVVTKLSNQSLCYYSGLPTNPQRSAFRLQTQSTTEDGNKPRDWLVALTH